MVKPLLLHFYSFLMGKKSISARNCLYDKKSMLLKKSFLLDFVGGEPFLVEMEQYPAFWGYRPPLFFLT
jgi:hypothetical protein